jgi:hypothetical protein
LQGQAKHEEKLTTDFTDFADLFGHKKAQKTSAFAKATADRLRHEEKLATEGTENQKN